MSESMSESISTAIEAAVAFAPPRWLANAHLQSILPSLRLRRPWLTRRARELVSSAQSMILDCGDGVRLLGHYSSQAALGRPKAKHLAVLLHGWEGSADSLYILSLGSYLFGRGCDVFRLNFRDHGPSHHLNEELFHSCRIAEVVGAVKRIQELAPDLSLSVAGFSLGGNFALRVAARAREAGLKLERAIGICPVLSPHSTLETLESGPFIYHRYFVAKWKRSLAIKQRLFPHRYDFRAIMAERSIRRMTDIMVRQYSEFATLDDYLNGYSICGDALARLEVPSHVLFALDDPIIPARDLDSLARNPHLQVSAIPYGGHCGFMERFGAESWADREVARLMGL
jgi:predicted alpha/beta-fold hydrolase